MTPTITSIEDAGPQRRARRLHFSDGAEPRTTSAAVVRALGLEQGVEFDERSVAEAEAEQARERALRVLGYRERSTAELVAKLTDDGYPARLAHQIADRFVELSLLDDTRFAELWARNRIAAGYGRRRIADELARKGIDADVARSALDGVLGDSELARARDCLRGRRPADRKERDRMLRRLVSRGFDMGTALAAMDTPDEPQG